MGFYAANFVYNGIMSSEYGLRITSDSESDSTPGANVNLFTQELYRKPRNYLLGVQQTPALEIPIRINTSTELSAMEDSVISNWLFGSLNYKKLQIIQPDMQYVYYNCIFKDKTVERVGNIIRGYTANIVCDSPFAWEEPRTVDLDYSSAIGSVVDTYNLTNTSDNADYTYPTITFQAGVDGATLSIINTTDNLTRRFLLTNLLQDEIVTVNSDIELITSSYGRNLLPYFFRYNIDGTLDEETSYNWLRLVQGQNELKIVGNIKTLSISHQCARKIS